MPLQAARICTPLFGKMMAALTNRRRPFQRLVRWHAIEDSLWVESASYARCDAEVDKRKLRRPMRVRPYRDPTSFFPGNFEQIYAEILPIRGNNQFRRPCRVPRRGQTLRPSRHSDQDGNSIYAHVGDPKCEWRGCAGRLKIALSGLPSSSDLNENSPVQGRVSVKQSRPYRPLPWGTGSTRWNENAHVVDPVIDRRDFLRLLC
jgi:hypothetical protein